MSDEEDDSISSGAYVVLGLLGACIFLVLIRQILRYFHTAAARPEQSHPRPRKAKVLNEKIRSAPVEEPAVVPKGPAVSLKHLKKQAQAAQKTKGQGNEDQDKASQHPLYLGSFKGHKDTVTGLAFSRDGTQLATSCEDQSMRVYAVADLAGKGNPVRARNFNLVPGGVAFGQTNNQLLAVLQSFVDGAVLTSNAPNHHKSGPAASFDTEWELPKIHGGKEQAKQLLSAQSIAVVLSEKSQMRLISLTGQPLTIIETAGLTNHGAALSRDGRFLAAATFTADVKVHEIRYNRQGGFESVNKVMDLKGHKRQVMCIAFSPDNSRAAIASQDGTWSVWNIDVRFRQQEDPKRLLQETQEVPSGQCYCHMAYGARGILAAAYGSTLHFLNAESGQLLESIPDAHDAAITAMEWTPQRLDEKASWSLATASKDRRLRLWRMPEP
ncbi:hypothetical protein WJX84_007132 [Apatococcus fuscideae]|uniref:Uncharacterized protein n=1 Tax=Apatococcus fuscideae TaxID=2026836 RepID=A0AAW1SX65_9CHLO